MKFTIENHEIEFDTPLKGIGLTLIGVGVMLILFGELLPDHSLRLQFYNLMLVCVGAAAVILVFDEPHETFTKWFAVTTPSGIIILAAFVLHLPSLAIMLVVPLSLAVVLSGIPALILLALADSLLLGGIWFLLPSDFPPSILLITLFAIWSLTVVQISIYRQIITLGSWSVGYWKKANEINTFTQNSQLNLEKALQNLAGANQLLIQSQRRTERLRLHAENAEKSRAMFVARVSHEFRTPLNMIIGLVELMVESPRIYSMRMPPELEKDLEIVLRNCQHLATMIDDVLELTRAESGSLILHREGVNLSEIINEACQVVSPLIKRKVSILISRYRTTFRKFIATGRASDK